MKPCLETDSPRPFLTCLTHRTAVYFASVCPVDCTGAWLSPHQAPAVIDECGDCNGLGRARDCRGVCRGPFAQTVVDGVAKARRGRMACSCRVDTADLPALTSSASASAVQTRLWQRQRRQQACAEWEAAALAPAAAPYSFEQALQIAFTTVALLLAALPFAKNTAVAERAVEILDSLKSRFANWWHSRALDVGRDFDGIDHSSSSSSRRHAVPSVIEQPGVEMSALAQRASSSLPSMHRARGDPSMEADADADDDGAPFPPAADEYLASALALPSTIEMPSAPPLPEGMDMPSSSNESSSSSSESLPPSLPSNAPNVYAFAPSAPPLPAVISRGEPMPSDALSSSADASAGSGNANGERAVDSRDGDANDDDHAGDEDRDDGDGDSDADGGGDNTALARRAAASAVASSVDARSEI